MLLLTQEQNTRLRANGQFNATRTASGKPEMDFMPVVKLFCPWTGATWLLTELDPEDPDIAFGLCDLGLGFPELGSVRISELEAVRGPDDHPFCLGVQWHPEWNATQNPVSVKLFQRFGAAAGVKP